ncbi:MAG: tripartite tricarboxylate transporter TctB family protein [Candidatus Binatia bacterium]
MGLAQYSQDHATELKRTRGFFGWFIGGALGIWLLGLIVALPVLVFLYALVEGKEKWYVALIAAGCTYALVWGLFEYMLETRWPSGIFFDEWINDFVLGAAPNSTDLTSVDRVESRHSHASKPIFNRFEVHWRFARKKTRCSSPGCPIKARDST